MNIREIKLAITVKLMNLDTGNYLNTIQELMQSFTEQVGAFIGLEVLKDAILNQDHSLKTFALQYENCTLNIDLIQNNTTNSQYVNRLDVF